MAIRLNDLLVGSDGFSNLCILHTGVLSLGHLKLALVESFSFHLPLSFQSSDNVLVLPSNLGFEIKYLTK